MRQPCCRHPGSMAAALQRCELDLFARRDKDLLLAFRCTRSAYPAHHAAGVFLGGTNGQSCAGPKWTGGVQQGHHSIAAGEPAVQKDRCALIAVDERTIGLTDRYETRRMCDVALTALRCNMLTACRCRLIFRTYAVPRCGAHSGTLSTFCWSFSLAERKRPTGGKYHAAAGRAAFERTTANRWEVSCCRRQSGV